MSQSPTLSKWGGKLSAVGLLKIHWRSTARNTYAVNFNCGMGIGGVPPAFTRTSVFFLELLPNYLPIPHSATSSKKTTKKQMSKHKDVKYDFFWERTPDVSVKGQVSQYLALRSQCEPQVLASASGMNTATMIHQWGRCLCSDQTFYKTKQKPPQAAQGLVCRVHIVIDLKN